MIKMSHCPECGSQTNVNDVFCDKCGTSVNNLLPPPPNSAGSSVSTKPITGLSIGAMIGGGMALLCLGLFIVFALNALYTQQISYFAAQNIQVSIYASGLDNMIFLISLGGGFAVLGIYSLVMGGLYNFSVKTRVAMTMRDERARIGNGLITGGVIATTLFFSDLIQQLYRHFTSSWYEPVLILFVIVGLIAIFTGAFLIRKSYFQSLKPTKV
jgi:hypothetical protein